MNIDDFSSKEIDEYQRVQFNHDRIYHSDILALGMLGRMRHIILHLIKYRAELSSSLHNYEGNEKAFIDTFIMLVSSSNALLLRVSEFHKHDNKECTNDFLELYIQVVGKLAKACESADHQEDHAINSEWKENTILLLKNVICEAKKHNINLIEKAKIRLAEVESRNKLNFILKDIQ